MRGSTLRVVICTMHNAPCITPALVALPTQSTTMLEAVNNAINAAIPPSPPAYLVAHMPTDAPYKGGTLHIGEWSGKHWLLGSEVGRWSMSAPFDTSDHRPTQTYALPRL